MGPPAGFERVERVEVQRERPEAVRVWLLGGFRVSVGPRAIEGEAWRLRKAAALVKLLALAPDHRLHREQAMDLLWPVSDRRAASNNLRQALHGARRALSSDPAEGSRYLSSEGESLVLCPRGELRVDVEAFEEAVETARRSRDSAAYRAAIELYAGDLLPGDRYEEWAEGRRENLRQKYLALLIELAGLYEERSQHGPAIVALQKAVAENPTFEEAHAGLMRLYALSARSREALAQYERLRETLSRRLDMEPGETTQRLREDIAAGSYSSDRPQVGLPEELPATAKHNLPAARTSFVGREQEIVEIKRELAMTRLLTLTGAGGTGKTRLALEVAKELFGTYPDGVWLVELAGLSDGTLVPQALAATLEVQEQADQSLTDTLIESVREKKTLLVLDNCEHLIDATARLTDTLLGSCPHLTVLATSREPLGIAGEIDRPVPALSAPDIPDRLTVEELEGYESARLFAERALFVERTLYGSSGFAMRSDNARAVAEICSRLEGMPLAIELAAAWVGTLSVEQISERLKDSLRLLRSGSRTITPRQQTLRGALDWSYDLLGESEQIMFMRLSVFAAGWRLEAAEAVTAGGGVEAEAVLELLWVLVNKSLVVAESETQDAAARYRMLEPIRQYAREKLEESGEADEVQDRYAAFFLALAEEAEPELAGARQGLWLERLEAEHDNLGGALSWVLEAGEGELGLRFGAALWRFWHTRSYLSEGIRWLERVLASDEWAASPVRVKALEGMGWLAQSHGESELATTVYEEMLRLSRELGDKGSIATALNSLGTVAAYQGDHVRARALLEENLGILSQLETGHPDTTLKRFHVFNLLGLLALDEENEPARAIALWEESLKLARKAGDPHRISMALCNLGYAAVLQGDFQRGTMFGDEALELVHEQGNADLDMLPEILVNLGLAALGQGNLERAAASFDKAVAMSREVGRKPTTINALEGMASLAAAFGDAPRAAYLWGAAEAERESTGIALPPGDRDLHEPYLAAARSQVGDSAWEGALAEGRMMSLEEAAEYALSKEELDLPTAPVAEEQPAREPIGELTHREQEVAVLVAQGLTNRQISINLSISERTVENHVAKIFGKLGLRSRAQIATWVTEHHLLTRPDPV